MIAYEDLYQATVATTAEAALAGRLDSAVLGVTSTESVKKKVTGISGKCANTGYLILRLAGATIATIGMATLHAITGFIPLDIDVPIGQTLSVYHKSSSGTAAVEATLQYQVG